MEHIFLSSRLQMAIGFCLYAHRKQTRKINDIPFATHPMSVGILLAHYGFSEDIVIAGILHDTVEDTLASVSDIRLEFGDAVAKLVEEVTIEKKGRPWRERKEDHLQRLQNISRDALAITAADQTQNLQSLIEDYNNHGAVIWKYFHAGAQENRWFTEAVYSTLSKRLDHPIMDELSQTIKDAHEAGIWDNQEDTDLSTSQKSEDETARKC